MRAVNQYTLSGEFVKRYNTIKEAADSVGTSVATVYSALNRRTKYKKYPTRKGYIWMYAEEGDNMLEFNLRNGKNVSLTDEEAKVAVKYYRTMIGMLDELEKNPRMIPAMKQAMYEAIREINGAKTTAEEENAEENTNEEKESSSMVD